MYSAETYEVLFDKANELPENIQWGEYGRMRTISVKHGPMLDVNICPIWKTWDPGSRKKASEAKKASTAAQVRLNERNSRRRLEWKMNANFGPGDMLVHPTLDDAHQPDSAEQALKIIRWYVGKLREAWRKMHPTEPFGYIYVIEQTVKPDGRVVYHYHMVMSGSGMDREQVEGIWRKRFQSICNTQRYQKNDRHLTGFARYLNLDKPTQTKATTRWWNCSKGLVNPKSSRSDHRVSRAKAQKIARGFEEDAKAVLEKAYPGYVLLGGEDAVRVMTSEWCQGVYIYAKMRRRD